MSLALWNQIPLGALPVLLALLAWMLSLSLRLLDLWRWAHPPRRLKFRRS
jgi:hypothetical protein